MKKDKATSKISTDLRAQAEEALQYRKPQKLLTEDLESLVHELGVHQIELEMQNEELRRAQTELKEISDRYADLYDFAPVGYFTFNPKGLILEVNLTGARQLGVERSCLTGTPFSIYVSSGDKNVFYSHLNQVFRTGEKQTCELRFIAKSKKQFYARLESMAAKDSEGKLSQCRTAVSDITERKRVEEAIRESEEQYRTLVESAKDLIATVSSEGIITSLNPAFEKITGWARDEWLGRDFQSLIHPEDLPGAMEAFQRIMSGETLPGSELRLLASSGDYVPVEYATTALTKDGEVIGNLSIVRDITERKRAEAKLQKSEEQFRTSIENMLDAFGIYSAIRDQSGSIIDFKVEYVNAAACESNMMTMEEQVGRGLLELLPGHRESGLFDEYCRVVETGKPLIKDSLIYEGVYSGGLRLQKAFDIRASKLNDGFVAAWREVTERRRAEDMIREQAELLDKAQDAIALRDLEHRIIYWNKGAERLYGWTAEEVIGKNPVEYLFKGKEEPSQLIEAKRIVLEKGVWAGELRQLTRDGKEITVESRWTLLHDNEDKPKSILIINTDITEKKRLEAQFLRTQRLESIGTLAGGIAHDLNNVLTPVMLSIQILNEKFKDEQSQKLLNILQNNTQRGADLIKQVLSFARGVEGERKTVQIERLIAEIGKVAKETFPRSIEIKTDVNYDLWDIIGDATQLHQVLMNLCVNSRDAMPDGGTLTISAGNVSIDDIYARMHIDAKVGSYISISVSDTGTGIPPEIMDRIFDPFFTTKEQGKGTGLGLSTVLTIVKSHGGFIDVHSEVGVGTSFKVYLPAMAVAQSREGDAPAPELQSGHGESILIVDDEVSILDVTGATLEQSGYRVLTAGDGVEAISLYAQNREEIKVILMDMMMPVMDGPSCIHALRRIDPKVKIIGVSGLTEKGRLEKNANIGVQAFLTKPYTSEMLLKTISQVISTE